MKKKIGQNCCLYLLLLNIGFRSPVVKASRLHREDHEFKSHREHFFFERRCSDTRGAAISWTGLSVLPMSFFFFGPRIFSIFKIWKLYYSRRRSSVIEFCDSYCNFLDNSYNYSTKESELSAAIWWFEIILSREIKWIVGWTPVLVQ